MIEELKRIFGSNAKAAEILYVINDLKPVARQGFYEHELHAVREFCARNGLALETASYKVLIDDADKPFSNKGLKVPISDKRHGLFFVYISKDREKALMANVAEMKHNHRELGKLLGYPDCCVEMFVNKEPERSKVDNDYLICTLENSKGKIFPFYTNISKRYKDSVIISHYPCSFKCVKSLEIARKFYGLLAATEPSLASKISWELKGVVNIAGKEVEFV